MKPVPTFAPMHPSGFVRGLLRFPLILYRLGLGHAASNLPVMPMLVLTTRGRVSGLPRHTVLEYRRHGHKLYVISVWGARAHWYQNLLADPVATVQEGRRTFRARARVVEDKHEAFRALLLFRKSAPAIYDAIFTQLSNAERVDARSLPDVSDQFLIVRFDTDADTPPLPGVSTDLSRVWLLFAVAGIVAALFALLRVRRR